jgi:hypothetical protein
MNGYDFVKFSYNEYKKKEKDFDPVGYVFFGLCKLE